MKTADIYESVPRNAVGKERVLRMVRPVYSMPESPIRWLKTYANDHKTHLTLFKRTSTPSVMIGINEGKLEGIIGIQVDDTIYIGTESFVATEEELSK